MFNFIGFALSGPLNFAKKFVKSPIGTLFYGLVSKWYLVTMSLSVVVLYWVITGLNKAGVIELAFNTFEDAGHQIKGVAQHCTPLIRDLNAFLRCIIDTPEYTGDETSSTFEEDIKKEIQKSLKHPVNHNKFYFMSPYDDYLLSEERNTHLPQKK